MAFYTYNGTQDGTWTNSANWSLNGTPSAAFPTTGDTANFPFGVTNAVNASLNVATNNLANLIISQGFSGYIGDGTNYLQIGATLCSIGSGSGPGAPRLMLNFGTNQNTTTVYASSATTLDPGLEPIRLLATSTNTVFYILGGTVGYATNSDSDIGNIAYFNVDVTPGLTAVFDIGPGGAINNGSSTSVCTQLGGTVNAQSVGGTVTYKQSSGTLELFSLVATGTGAANVGILDINGTCLFNAQGTIGNLNVLGNGIADFTQYPAPRIVNNCSAAKGATLQLNNGAPNSITFSNGIVLTDCRLEDITLDSYFNATISLS